MINLFFTMFSALSYGGAYFPIKLLPQIEKYSRVSKAQACSRGQHESEPSLPPCSWSPSSIRKMNARRKVELSLCYLGDRQYVGKNRPQLVFSADVKTC